MAIVSLVLAFLSIVFSVDCFVRKDVWNAISCTERHQPPNCNLHNKELVTVDDFDRCGPAAFQSLNARNYYLGAAGRRFTYTENKEAFDRIKINPKMLRDVSKLNTETKILGKPIDFPVGLAPVALHKLAHAEGETATIKGISNFRTIMILSGYSSMLLEDVAATARGLSIRLWMQVYIFTNRTITSEIVSRAEKAGFEAIVVTADSPQDATLTCNSRNNLIYPAGVSAKNVEWSETPSMSASFDDIKWLVGQTKLPIIVKGLLSSEDASKAVNAGASGILVSNHGGRQMDGAPATIDALSAVMRGVERQYPRREVYLDGGVRGGSDVFKALARGAKMVFVGRPIIWGLALGGAGGVNKVMSLLRDELRETLALGGIADVSAIKNDSLDPPYPNMVG